MENRQKFGAGGFWGKLKHKTGCSLKMETEPAKLTTANLLGKFEKNNENTAIKKHFSAKCHYYLKLHNHFLRPRRFTLAVTTEIVSL